ncbi:protein adenylyltransferase SelO [Marinobacter orientalis]|uniref:Protein nucleotidyltransferase YdiU n=1 Tax=Marinobacter orientalis TaxID=1928859 RepID=A0A7Y0RBX5_9GAMM|nr:YdiU family protein [Marinobacter orientalis]NMT63395.1 YdiU family protein [Marinobacter orientalis]TGX48463.1 YdiU family protein [Marinobacter orientalis]
MSSNGFKIEHRYLELPDSFYTRVQPTPLKDARMVCFNDDLAREMGFHSENPQQWTGVGAGTELLEGMDPVAMKYTGHQFGMYNPDLGDGRGLLLWETIGPDGRRWDWHLKGAGMTPYSRFGDGKAVLRSTIREYLCSEAMAALGIRTTRALFMVSARDPVRRESIETAAALMRVAQSHIRFGHFEFATHHEGEETLRALMEHVIALHFPHLIDLPQDERYQRWFVEVVERTARMIADWQAVGFCHGVMNSDNMSIIGDTFDYGPYAFLDDFDAGYICNHTDQGGRYAYNRQPNIGFVNCQYLANALLPVMNEDDVRRGLRRYEVAYNERFLQNMRDKLGLALEDESDLSLIMDTFSMLHEHHVDYTLFFRGLSSLISRGSAPIRDLFVDRSVADEWLERYERRLQSETRAHDEREYQMRKVNPKYILRNYLAQQVILEAQSGDYKPMKELLEVLKKPFDEQPHFEEYAAPPPNWGKHLSISCSS